MSAQSGSSPLSDGAIVRRLQVLRARDSALNASAKETAGPSRIVTKAPLHSPEPSPGSSPPHSPSNSAGRSSERKRSASESKPVTKSPCEYCQSRGVTCVPVDPSTGRNKTNLPCFPCRQAKTKCSWREEPKKKAKVANKTRRTPRQPTPSFSAPHLPAQIGFLHKELTKQVLTPLGAIASDLKAASQEFDMLCEQQTQLINNHADVCDRLYTLRDALIARQDQEGDKQSEEAS